MTPERYHCCSVSLVCREPSGHCCAVTVVLVLDHSGAERLFRVLQVHVAFRDVTRPAPGKRPRCAHIILPWKHYRRRCSMDCNSLREDIFSLPLSLWAVHPSSLLFRREICTQHTHGLFHLRKISGPARRSKPAIRERRAEKQNLTIWQ